MDSEQSEAAGLIVGFVTAVTTAMGLKLQADVTETADLLRVNLSGEGAEWLVRRRGETLNALQHIVSTVFRDSVPEDQRVVVDSLGFRRDKDAEIRKMAQFMADKAVSSGTAQEMGPLNPYERRIVHMAVAEHGDATSESIGDAFMKTVIISAK
jgi:spoIIIJ-associated protein